MPRSVLCDLHILTHSSSPLTAEETEAQRLENLSQVTQSPGNLASEPTVPLWQKISVPLGETILFLA